ncbi:MAG TPA: hypothetical protein VFY84_20195 [Jiangellales bacterium]|nr:hypothetical protein [Jiangellales bacterium]
MSESLPTPPSGHRRRVLIGALIALATALILTAPFVFWALRGQTPHVTGTAPASAPTSASPPTPTGPAPDGRISMEELRNATIEVPAWPVDNLGCLAGRQTFVDGEVLCPADDLYYFDRHMLIQYVTRQPVYGDVDNDGAQETVVLVGCYVQGGGGQVVALDRDAAGNIVTMGTVVAMTGEVRVIDERSLRVLPDGTVEVSVGDYQNCCGADAPVQWQLRGYGWIGDRFQQVSGPSSFPVNPGITDTAVAAGPLVLGPPDADGVRHGTLTVTVTYVRGGTPDHLSLFFTMTNLSRDGSWPPVRVTQEFTVVDLPTPAMGQSATYSFAFRQAPNTPLGSVHLSLAGMRAEDTGDPLEVGRLTEWTRENNEYSVAVTLAG